MDDIVAHGDAIDQQPDISFAQGGVISLQMLTDRFTEPRLKFAETFDEDEGYGEIPRLYDIPGLRSCRNPGNYHYFFGEDAFLA